ncbi:MAG: sialate O-acetylesterase, partial [Bacteroidales bacterium]|nr:sialate O-acetylesterase [Bacteroidales bacterium]
MKFHNFRMNERRKIFILSLAMFSISCSLLAEVTLPAVFTDNMVMQQKSAANVWGKAKANTSVKVTTSWDKKTYTTQAAADGKWSVKVNTPVASLTPFSMTISDGTAIELKNILIGDVWICSGQSNMAMSVARSQNYQQEVTDAKYPNIRLLQVSKQTSNRPLDDLKLERGGWQECSPSTIPDFSAAAYFFGRDLFQHQNIPIGLINTSWGGT